MQKKKGGKNMKKINWVSFVPPNKVKGNLRPDLVPQSRKRRERSKRKERCMQEENIPCRKADKKIKQGIVAPNFFNRNKERK